MSLSTAATPLSKAPCAAAQTHAHHAHTNASPRAPRPSSVRHSKPASSCWRALEDDLRENCGSLRPGVLSAPMTSMSRPRKTSSLGHEHHARYAKSEFRFRVLGRRSDVWGRSPKLTNCFLAVEALIHEHLVNRLNSRHSCSSPHGGPGMGAPHQGVGPLRLRCFAVAIAQ